MKKLTKYTLAIALQTVIIFSIIIFKMVILTGGTEVVLQIEPVDPTSPLRGDYAAFRYSSLSNPDSYLAGGLQIRNGDMVYVVLRQTGKYWTAERMQTAKPADNSQVFIKGRVASGGIEEKSDFFADPGFSHFSMHVVYGIEEYFIPEGKGRNFSFSGKDTAARVSVDETGNAVLKGLLVDGKSWP